MKAAFTVLFGDYDELKDPEVITPGWEYFCFTDQELTSTVWQPLPKPKSTLDNYYLSRLIWNNVQDYLPGIELSLEVGGRVQICCNLDELFEKYLTGYDIAIQRHFIYKDIKQELNAVLKNKQADETKMLKAFDEILSTGFPLEFGLFSLGYVLRRHTEATHLFYKRLTALIMNGSHREQMYFPYVWWRYGGIKVNVIEERIETTLFKHFPHKENKDVEL